MAKELNEDSGFHVSIKTLVGIGVAMATVISMWFVLSVLYFYLSCQTPSL